MPTVLERLREALAPDIRVERELASGGMGTVFLGRDVSLDRAVAIKILRPELSTALGVERFLREAQYLANLNHPNILPVHVAGESNGLVYYVMDYVDGETLDQRIARGPLGLSETIELGRGLLSALAAAHRKGVIHRDIKPANIFLVNGRAMLGDFGIAHTVHSEGTALTQPGQSVGTPLYMAPEQVMGAPVTPQTDLYALGLVLFETCTAKRWDRLTNPAEGDWSRVPPELVPVLWKALEWLPQERWQDAERFSRALPATRQRPRWQLASLLPLSALGLYFLLRSAWPDTQPATGALAIFPFEVVGLADTALGGQLARLTGSYLEALPGVSLSPPRTAFRQWNASTLPPAERLARLTAGGAGTEYGVWGVVRPSHGGIEVRLQVVNAGGHPVLDTVVRGDPSDRIGLGDSIALQLVRRVLPRSEQLYRSAGGLSSIDPRAVPEFLFGEEAAERSAWLTAERHYRNALALDSAFVLAAWRLANVHRWMPTRSDPPLPPGFLALYQAQGQVLPKVDRLLIEAQFAPGGRERFDRYTAAMRQAPRDAYPPLFYGDELFHRGPLSGRSRDEAIDMLRQSVARDSFLAPAHEHLAWALIRSGRREEARRSLDALRRVAGSPEESEIFLPAFLELAYLFRFAPDSAPRNAATLQSPFALALAARGALAFDLPELENDLGARLAGLASAPPTLHGSGQIARGLALMALGRATTALAHFDSAIPLLEDHREARLQAAGWRVIPAALGIPGVPVAEVERGRRELVLLANDTVIGTRAAWALAIDALAKGDTGAAAPWVARVASRPNQPLALLLRGMQQAAAGKLELALALSEPALAYDSAGRAGDPFFRAALHLQRGGWYASSHRPGPADAAWLWYENLDVVGWPDAAAQAGEVDWAIGTFARLLRGRLARDSGNLAKACSLMAPVERLWAGAAPEFLPLLAEVRGVTRQCPR